jgi:hypothetical protein
VREGCACKRGCTWVASNKLLDSLEIDDSTGLGLSQLSSMYGDGDGGAALSGCNKEKYIAHIHSGTCHIPSCHLTWTVCA